VKVTTGPTFAGTFVYFSEVVAGLDYILTERPDVQIVNMSLVTYAQFAGNCDNTTAWNIAGAAAINVLRARGVIAFASAGNRGGSLMSSPACLSNVVSVGATDNNDRVAPFSDSNSATDLMAPGVGISAPNMGGSTVQASGTSMASPHAAGCAALLIASSEAITPDEIETRLKASAPRVYNPRNGLTYPRIECSVKPLTSVLLSGLAAGFVDLPYQYHAVTNPITATQPISYFWVPPPLQGQGTPAATYRWTLSGSYAITVTATNAGGLPVNDALIVTISAVPSNWNRTFLPWVSR
jgi:subtilisin family serine protease